jgi:hypothetical protein
MVWLFLSVVLIVVVYLAVQFPAFRKAILVCLALLASVVAVWVGWLNQQEKENQKRVELERRLIRDDEVVFNDMRLGQGSFALWTLKGNVTNRSSHELSGFTLKVTVQDCSGFEGRCVTIGENVISDYLSVPPNQMRAFERTVHLDNMPERAKWQWTYAIQEVRGKLK